MSLLWSSCARSRDDTSWLKDCVGFVVVEVGRGCSAKIHTRLDDGTDEAYKSRGSEDRAVLIALWWQSLPSLSLTACLVTKSSQVTACFLWQGL